VDICTPTQLHHAQVLQAAAAGKHIICEKPLARTLEQGRDMLAACAAAGVKLLVAHVVRFFPQYAHAEHQVRSGAIGKPAVLRLAREAYRPKKPVGNWFLDVEKSGGILLDMMIHDFDYARWVAGDVSSVFAKDLGGVHPDAPIDFGLAILKHKNGALTHVVGAWAYPPPNFRTGIEIAGDAGLIEWKSADTAPLETFLHQREGSAPDVGLPSSPLRTSPFTAELQEFYDAIAYDRPTRVTAADGLAALEISLAAIESAQTNMPITLDDS
jgi:predicted dehydrogenase